MSEESYIKSLLNSVYVTLHSRFASPLFGSFAAAWVCWNHEYIFILISGLPIDYRLQLARSCFPDGCSVFLSGVLWPLLCALGFIFLYPWPSRLIYVFWHTQNQKLREEKLKIERATILTQEEAQKIFGMISRVTEEHRKEVVQYTQEIQQLREENKAAREPVDTVYKPITDWMDSSWGERHFEIDQIFTQIGREVKTVEDLRAFMERLYGDLVKGTFGSRILTYVRDITPSVIGPDGRFIYHPAIGRGNKPEALSYLNQVVKDRNGTFIQLNSLWSEQVKEFLGQERFDEIYGLLHRFTRVEFKEVLGGQAYVVFECHINVFDAVPIRRPRPSAASPLPAQVPEGLLGLLTYLSARMEGASSAELIRDFPRVPGQVLAERLDQGVDEKTIFREPIDTQLAQYRYKITSKGRALLPKAAGS